MNLFHLDVERDTIIIFLLLPKIEIKINGQDFIKN
jgi:hypothetical protein